MSTSTTSLPCPGIHIIRSIITDQHWDITDIRYSAEENLYCSEQPSVFSYIVLKDFINIFYSLSSEIKRLLCAVVVAASCLLSSDKKEWNTAWLWRDGIGVLMSAVGNALKVSNVIPSIYTDLFTPYYSDCIW